MNHLTGNLTILRKQKLLDLDRFARLTGLPESLIADIEAGTRQPNCDELILLAEALNVSLDRLLKEDLRILSDRKVPFDLKFLALDVDGVLTDAGMYYTQNGDEFKKFNAKDGLAIKMLVASGVPVGFISSGINDHIIRERAKLLGVHYVYVGTWKKLDILQQWCKELNIELDQVAYIGDDINDLPVLTRCGFSACPADAVHAVRQQVNVVLNLKGGEGCVREFTERFVAPLSLP